MSYFSKHKILKRFYKPVYNLTSARTPNFNLFTVIISLNCKLFNYESWKD